MEEGGGGDAADRGAVKAGRGGGPYLGCGEPVSLNRIPAVTEWCENDGESIIDFLHSTAFVSTSIDNKQRASLDLVGLYFERQRLGCRVPVWGLGVNMSPLSVWRKPHNRVLAALAALHWLAFLYHVTNESCVHNMT